MHAQFFGLYRGIVTDNADPMQLGRLRLSIPAINAAPGPWALPSVPLAGHHAGVYVLPQIGANVWVQFEAGSPDYPVWTGGWWARAEDVPPLALDGSPPQPAIVLQTPEQHALVISDRPGPLGGLVLRSPGGATIVVNDTGIHLSTGQGAEISLVGSSVRVKTSTPFQKATRSRTASAAGSGEA